MLQVFDKDVYTLRGTLESDTRVAAQYLYVGLYSGTHSFDRHTQQMELGGTTLEYVVDADLEYRVQSSDVQMECSFDTSNISIGLGATVVFNQLFLRVEESLASAKVSIIPRAIVDPDGFGGVVKKFTTVASPGWSLVTPATTKRCGPHGGTCDLLVVTSPIRSSELRVHVENSDRSVHDTFVVRAFRVDIPNGIGEGGK